MKTYDQLSLNQYLACTAHFNCFGSYGNTTVVQQKLTCNFSKFVSFVVLTDQFCCCAIDKLEILAVFYKPKNITFY